MPKVHLSFVKIKKIVFHIVYLMDKDLVLVTRTRYVSVFPMLDPLGVQKVVKNHALTLDMTLVFVMIKKTVLVITSK